MEEDMNPSVLIVYYSRSGNTRKVADMIAHLIDCDVEPIVCKANLSGFWGFIKCVFHAVFNKLPQINEIEGIEHDLEKYKVVLIGTPIWGGRISSPIRTFIDRYKDKLTRVAFFATMGAEPNEGIFRNINNTLAKEPVAILIISVKELKGGINKKKLNDFITPIQDLSNV
jgi:flavodoxin